MGASGSRPLFPASQESNCMTTDIGEYIVGAYLKLKLNCDFVNYNVRHTGGKMKGLGEFDVGGIDFTKKIASLCEVTTHITGLLIGDNQKTIAKIKAKHERQKQYAKKHLREFEVIYMFWSPVVARSG